MSTETVTMSFTRFTVIIFMCVVWCLKRQLDALLFLKNRIKKIFIVVILIVLARIIKHEYDSITDRILHLWMIWTTYIFFTCIRMSGSCSSSRWGSRRLFTKGAASYRREYFHYFIRHRWHSFLLNGESFKEGLERSHTDIHVRLVLTWLSLNNRGQEAQH